MGISLKGLNSGLGDVYSSLLSSGAMSSGGIMDNSALLNDYASIKNGSYGKMMKAYYAKQKAAIEEETSSTQKTQKAGKTKDAAVAGAAKKFYDTASKMRGLDYSAKNINQLYDEVSAFVKDYNSLITRASKSKNASVQAQADALNDYTYKNYKLFAQVGITMNADRTLSIDEKTFKKVNEKTGATNIPTLKTLFQGNNSFAERAAGRVSKMYRTAGDGDSILSSKARYAGTTGSVSSGSTTTSSDKEADKTVKDASAASLADTLYKSVEKIGAMTMDNSNKNALYDAFSTLTKDYNALIKKASESNNSNVVKHTGYLKTLVSGNRGALAEIGITINSDKSLSINEEKFKAADMESVKKLYSGAYSFAEKMTDRVKQIQNYAAQGDTVSAKPYTSQGSYGAVDTGTMLDAIT